MAAVFVLLALCASLCAAAPVCLTRDGVTGCYTTNYNSSGWNYLTINDPVGAKGYDVGYVEGALTCHEIHEFYGNFIGSAFGVGEGPGEQTSLFLEENYRYMEKMVANNPNDEYWQEINFHLQQLNGLYDGYINGCAANIKKGDSGVTFLDTFYNNPKLLHFLVINSWGDLYQIAMKYREKVLSRFMGNRGEKVENEQNLKLIERCSALFKLVDNNADIVFGHNTWDSYDSLGPRILKNINRGKSYSTFFSSSPALLSSVDDFFISKNEHATLTVIETTNSLYNLHLLEQVVPTTTLSWIRAISSNKLAHSGYNWAETFAKYHSGTYTNQWMVLDHSKFTPGAAPQAGFFVVLEEVPGTVRYEDQTDVLVSKKYWPSYNYPYYDNIQVLSGYERLCTKNSDNCYDHVPRANLFRANQASIQDVSGGKAVMQYNDFQNDPLSLGDPCNAIACRGDLYEYSFQQGGFGALDAKVSSFKTVHNFFASLSTRLFWAKLGPTTDEQNPFCWSNLKDEASYSHTAQSECFDYSWEVFPPA
jgi:hypothetical protein